ncbi:hypothetical protein ARSEF1564_005181 [Beauveria bassiana]
MSPVDALIIGAGPAGLAAALALTHQLHTAVVFDSSLFRNACSTHMHTIPTGDHKDPAAFRGATRKEILERAKQITSKAVIYTSNNPAVQTAIAELVGQNDAAITTDDREIASLALGPQGSGITITFADGSSVQEAFLVHRPPTKLNSPFAAQLGVELTPAGDVKVTPPFGATSVKGVYAAGDCATPMKNAMQAMHMGTFAGVGIAHDLQAEGPKM